jgi:4-amino-4-deoxy-L-arabinose transferase-like glycosyltransferase
MSRVLALLLVTGALFFVGLSSYDLDTKGEPREGFTAWEIIHTGDWALPRLNGEAIPEKPLVFPWLVALSTLALGEGGELAPRLPSALMGVGLVLVVYCLGRRLQGEGFVPALVCATTALTVSLARRARVDMTLAFFVAFALLQFLRALERPRLGTVLVFWISVTVATLTKGPIGVALPSLAIGSYLYLEGRLAFARRLLPGLPLFLVGAGWWYANGLRSHGYEFAHHSFLMENILMFVGAKSGGGHEHGTFYYFKYLPSHFFPWSLYLPAALHFAWKRRGDARVAFPLAWLLSQFVFFSIARGKRADYLLPLVPAASLIVADLWRRGSGRALELSSAAGAAAATAGLAVYPFAKGLAVEHLGFEPPPLFLVAGVAVAIVPWIALALGHRRSALASIAGGTTLLVLTAVTQVLPKTQETRPFTEEVARVAGSGRLVEHGFFDYATLYYLRRRIPTVDREEAQRTLDAGGFAIVSPEAFGARPLLRGAVVARAPDRVLLAGIR